MSFITNPKISNYRKFFYLLLMVCLAMVAIALVFAVAEKVQLILQLLKQQ